MAKPRPGVKQWRDLQRRAPTLGRASGRVGALGGVAEVLQEQQAGHAHQRQGRAALVVTGELDRAGCGKVLGPGESHRGGTVWALPGNNDRRRAATTPDGGWGLQKFIGRVALATEPTAGIDTLAASHRPHPPWPPWN